MNIKRYRGINWVSLITKVLFKELRERRETRMEWNEVEEGFIEVCHNNDVLCLDVANQGRGSIEICSWSNKHNIDDDDGDLVTSHSSTMSRPESPKSLQRH